MIATATAVADHQYSTGAHAYDLRFLGGVNGDYGRFEVVWASAHSPLAVGDTVVLCYDVETLVSLQY